MLTRSLQRLFKSSVKPASRSSRYLPAIEMLEARIAPASTVTFSHGTLLVKGDPTGDFFISQTSEVVGTATVIHTTVSDGETMLGTGAFDGVKNIVVKLDPKATDTNNIHLDLQQIKGSVQVFSPKNASTQLYIEGHPLEDGAANIGGSVQLKGGAGYDLLYMSDTKVGGSIVLIGGKGGNQAYLDTNVVTGGGATFLDTPSIQLNAGVEIGKHLLITQKSNATEFYILAKGSKVNGTVSIFAGPGSTTLNAYGEVGGKFFVNMGAGPAVGNFSLIAKSLEYVGSSYNDTVSLFNSNITDNVRIALGGGSNTVAFDLGALPTLAGDFHVGKSLSIYGGKSNDIIRLDSTSHVLSVGGNTIFSLGGGDNLFAWNGTSAGNSFHFATASGRDSLYLFGFSAPNAVLNAKLGSGNDRVLMSAGFKKVILDGQSGVDEILGGSLFPDSKVVRGFEVGI